jgi:hypothetical protein
MGSRDGSPSMQIITEWYATNASKIPVRILDTELLIPNPKGRTCKKITMMISRSDNHAHEGIDMPIPPHKTATVSATFFLDPPTQKEDKPIKIKLFVIDQYGHKHQSPKIRTKYRFPSAEIL